MLIFSEIIIEEVCGKMYFILCLSQYESAAFYSALQSLCCKSQST